MRYRGTSNVPGLTELLTLFLPSAMFPPRHRRRVSSQALHKSLDSQSEPELGDPAVTYIITRVHNTPEIFKLHNLHVIKWLSIII